IKRIMVGAVDRVNVLLDASKFDKQSFRTFTPMSHIDYLFTDDKIPSAYVALCRELEIELILA
ncbi:MAG: hypothetical protein ACOC9Z_08770, partial [Chloroflexota bacterium]